MRETIGQFIVGELYSNEEIFKSFSVANAGGLRFRMDNGDISRAVLMTSVPLARKAKENPYHDRIENGILTYTAAGREGDQTLAGMNKRLPTQLTLNFPIHGFLIVANRDDKRVGPKRWQYLGLLEYIRHFPDTQLDTKGALRKVWILEFRIHSDSARVPLEHDERLMSEILFESRKRNPTSEEERTVSTSEQNTSNQLDPVRVEAVRGRLLNVNPDRFEHLLKDLLSVTGFARIQVTKYSQDGGIDLNAYTGETMWALGDWLVQFQAKRWIHTVGRKEIAELRGSLQPFARGTVITTSHFSKAAILEAGERGKNPIHLVDGFELSRTIIERKVEAAIFSELR
ncbi:MAG TPA: restriction endonuclease [Verrucomicrobiae bacterium]|nr:restriction endonuclease [Verrucomicrobiae bacterium]